MILNKSRRIPKKKNRTKFFSSILITMLNLFDKKTKNTSPDISNTRALNFFSDTAKDITNQNNIGETRHYPPATKE
jgi:predicted nucleotide-binding protein (sugar kinase/HSP70/actin superfamily)